MAGKAGFRGQNISGGRKGGTERESQSDLRYQGKEEKEGGLERQWL